MYVIVYVHLSDAPEVDEFQETLERWLDGHREGVSAGGFCEVLQGSTAMSRGVVVITGTSELAAKGVRRKLPAVFRRIHCTAELTWMNERDIGEYFRRFLCGFIPSCPAEQWDSLLMRSCSLSEEPRMAAGLPTGGGLVGGAEHLHRYAAAVSDASDHRHLLEALTFGAFKPRKAAAWAMAGAFSSSPERFAEGFSPTTTSLSFESRRITWRTSLPRCHGLLLLKSKWL